jgi:Mg2+/Co2+ transporter CorB
MIDVIIILLLLLMLYFFSSAETALTGVSKPLMHQLELDGSRAAALVNRLQERSDRLLGSILLGNTLAQILASSMATSLAITWFGDAGIAYGAVLMTVLVLVFCEILPKTVALNHANTLAPTLAPAMRLVTFVFGPPVMGVQALVTVLLHLVGVRTDGEANHEANRAELRGAIEIHTTEGEERKEGKMLSSILDLADVEVWEVMTHRKNLTTIDAGQPVTAILEEVTSSAYSRIPLWRGTPDNIVGILRSKELLRAVRASEGAIDTLDVAALAAPPWFIPESTTLFDQLQEFRRRREHFAIVVDEYGALEGVVTLEDIIEEIVGDIDDEHDVAVVGVRPQPDGSYLVNGDVTLRDLNREYDWRLPDADASTIAGLLMHESRMIPEQGQTFRFYGFRFEVVHRVRNHISQIRITPPKEEDDG